MSPGRVSERGSSTILNLGLVAILVGIGIGGYLVLGRSGGQQAQAQAATTAVTGGNVRASVSASGTIESDRTVGVSFETTGTVANLRVEIGDEVKKDQALARLEDSAGTETVLRAPVAGTVVEVNGGEGDTVGSTGETSDSTATAETDSSETDSSSSSGTSGFIVISDLDDLDVRAYFSETDTARLRVGQRARVTLNAAPDRTLRGRVRSIDLTSTTVNQVVAYGVTIELDDRPARVRIGQTAVAVVVTDRASDVLVVPSAAVQTVGGQSTVTVMRNGQQVSVPVEVGLEGDQQTEIVSGLSEGERVVIPSATGPGGEGGFPPGGFPGLGGGPGGPGGGP